MLALYCFAMIGACRRESPPALTQDLEWTHYAGDPGGMRYSAATLIHRGNVDQLQIAWKVRVGDFAPSAFDETRDSAGLPPRDEPISEVRFESTPVMLGRTLFVSSPLNRVLALDPWSGMVRWTFDPKVDRTQHYLEGFTSRGVAVWVDWSTAPGRSCATTVFLTTVDARLVALDGTRGVPCDGFGVAGTVNLDRGAGVAGRDASRSHITITSPPAVIGDVVVVGSSVRESSAADAASGVVRAFDVRRGTLRWSFDPIPRRPTDPSWSAWDPAATRSTVGANVWSTISADPERDLIFLPVASAAPDYFGGGRPGRNDFANSVVALRASTGAVVWSFQVVHHDLWDYDLAAQPILVSIGPRGSEVPAVIVGTKTGMIFVLDRVQGTPLFPVEERAVPASNVPGEKAWPTQPFSVKPPPLLGTRLTPDSAFGLDARERDVCRDALRRLRNEGMFTPPSLEGTVQWPGFWGGINWDGLAWNPAKHRLVAATKRIAMVVRLQQRIGPSPGSFSASGEEHLAQSGAPYAATRMPLVAPSGTPCTPPPWSSLIAVDFEQADAAIRWSRPFGTVPWLRRFPRHREWGSVSFGGPLLTGGDLVFMGASADGLFRAIDIDDGSVLWEHPLPAGGQAAPMTYVVDGRQFVVIAAGGRAGIGAPGDWLVAFSLPERKSRSRARSDH